MMKTWKLILMLFLAFTLGACDDDPAEKETDGGGTSEQVDVVWGYEAKTVLKNSGQVNVPLKLDRAVNSVVKVTIETEKGDAATAAREGIDFNIPEKVVTIPAGDTIAFLALDLLDDEKAGTDREIKLKIAGVYGGGKVGALRTTSLYIVSNAFVEFEKAKWETWESAAVETSSEEVRNSRFVPLVITGDLTEAVTVVLEVTDSTAVEPTHFTVEKELTLAPGTTRANVEIKPVDDEEMNEDRIFILKIKEIRGGGSLVIGKTTPSCEVKILSEEVLRQLSWENIAMEITDKEETILNIPVTLNKIPLASFTADVVVNNQTDAVEDVDYQIVTPQIEIGVSCQAIVQVKVLANREVNANRTLVLNLANITDNSVYVKEDSKSFTLAIENSDFPSFEGESLEAIEDELNQVVISIPAVNRERQIVLEYATTESVSGAYFDMPNTTYVVPAGASTIQVPLNVKYTTGFPSVVPEFTMSIVKVGDFVLENAINTKLVLTPCNYRKLTGDWNFKIGSYNGNGVSYTDLVRDMTFEVKEWKKSFSVTAEFIVGWGNKTWTVNWDEETGDAEWDNTTPLYTNVGFGSGVDIYLRTAYMDDNYWTPFQYAIPMKWNSETKTFVLEISAAYGLRSDMRSVGGSDDANDNGTWFIFKDISMTKK